MARLMLSCHKPNRPNFPAKVGLSYAREYSNAGLGKDQIFRAW